MGYLDELNDAQKEAVENLDGPMMIIAGAGSGKTRVLTYRIAHLINNGVDPFKILALTFTNKAAKEMKERISEIAGSSDAQAIWMGTFHSVFAKILRIEAALIGYPNNFTIYDTSDSKNLLKSIIKDLGFDDKVYKPNLVQNRISSAKNNLVSAAAYKENSEIVAEDRMRSMPHTHEIYARYEQRCFRAGAMDFDDLLFKTNELLRDFPEVLNKYQHKFSHILVDEYQDTNFSQYLIVKKLAALRENLCVVGDDAQSIYAFRGANIENILNFKRDYPDYKLFKLEQNYRSTQTIVEAANSIISKNKDQIQKNVWTSNNQGNQIKVMGVLTDSEEGKLVANSIYERQTSEGCQYTDFAILYRTNAQSRSFEESLRKLNIPYKIYGGLSFYQRKEIKDILAYCRLTANHNDEEALKRVINYPKRGIGKTSIDKAIIQASEHQVSLWSVLSEPSKYGLEINAGTFSKIKNFTTMIRAFRTGLDNKSAYDLGNEIAKSTGLLKDLHDDKTPEGVSRYENVQELLNAMKEFSDSAEEGEIKALSDFLIDVALLTNADNEKEEDKNTVTLMTIHAAKGLEFAYVYIVGLEENLFPSQMSLHSRSDLEEERRLFYVALTRAQKEAMLSYAQSRYRWGNLIYCEPSRFLEEIDEKYLDRQEVAKPKAQNFDEKPWSSGSFTKSFGNKSSKSSPKKKADPAVKKFVAPKNLKKITSAPTSAEAANTDLTIGDNVMHERFGKGKIISIDGAAPNTKATVFFPSAGEKQLLLRFAKLEVVNE